MFESRYNGRKKLMAETIIIDLLYVNIMIDCPVANTIISSRTKFVPTALIHCVKLSIDDVSRFLSCLVRRVEK